LVDAAKGVIGGALDGIKNFLGINSPSKVFAEIGESTGKGMIIGLENMGGKITQASEDLGKGAVNGMSDALGRVQDVLDSDVELQPTIRPVVDMTNVEASLKSTFNRQRGLDVSASVEKASTVAVHRQNGGESSGSRQTSINDDSQLTINNHYVVRNDNDIRQISRDQNTLLERYRLAKGVPVPL